jgi:hypothetical protein
MLYVAEDGRAVDYLEADSEGGLGIPGFDVFTKTTWQLACDALQQFGGVDADLKLMALANDWQCLTWQNLSKRESERRAARLRADYYERRPGLPHYHEAQLKAHALSPHCVLRASDASAVFSEATLRHQLTRTIKAMMRDDAEAHHTGLRRYFDEHGESLVRLESSECTGAPVVLVQSGHTGCAGEVVELLNELQQRGIRKFINLYPAQCQMPVEAGTGMAVELFGLSDMVIANIAVAFSEPFIGAPA